MLYFLAFVGVLAVLFFGKFVYDVYISPKKNRYKGSVDVKTQSSKLLYSGYYFFKDSIPRNDGFESRY